MLFRSTMFVSTTSRARPVGKQLRAFRLDRVAFRDIFKLIVSINYPLLPNCVKGPLNIPSDTDSQFMSVLTWRLIFRFSILGVGSKGGLDLVGHKDWIFQNSALPTQYGVFTAKENLSLEYACGDLTVRRSRSYAGYIWKVPASVLKPVQ